MITIYQKESNIFNLPLFLQTFTGDIKKIAKLFWTAFSTLYTAVGLFSAPKDLSWI